MLSKWRKGAREGKLRGTARKAPPAGPKREIARLQALEREYALLNEEHALCGLGSIFSPRAGVEPHAAARCDGDVRGAPRRGARAPRAGRDLPQRPRLGVSGGAVPRVRQAARPPVEREHAWP